MTFEEAKLHKQNLDSKNKMDSDNLRAFDKGNENPLGTPDHIRALPEWKLAKREYDKSFAELREFNTWYVKAFKKDLAKERRNRFSRKAV